MRLLLLAAALVASFPAAAGFTDLGAYAGDPRCEDSLATTCMTDADYSGMAYLGGKVYLYGGGHAGTYENAVPSFDPLARSWSYGNARTPCADRTSANVDSVNGRWISDGLPITTHTYDLVVPFNGKILVAANGEGRGSGCNNLDPVLPDKSNYVIFSGVFRLYDPATDSWTYTSIPAVDYTYAAEPDPISGSVLFIRRTGLWVFDGTSYTQILSFNNIGMTWQGSLVYSPATDKFYYLGQTAKSGYLRSVWEITYDRATPGNSTVVETSAIIPSTASVSGKGMGWALNPNDGKIYGGLVNGVLVVFNPADYSVNTLSFTDQYCGTALLTTQGYAWTWVPELSGFLTRIVSGACHYTALYQP